MRYITPTFRHFSFTGRVLFCLGFAALVVLTMMTVIFGSLTTTMIAALLLILFMASGPYVIGGGWRTPKAQPTRRPVVRRRRY
jgi:hypothetical protein